ncbi:MAG TPA: proline dehydrogenase family protein [Thermoanaerobaculia bacterium]|nr:proline dehydrogenase family protein [Thermoanaerobaculia bacterium]
MSIARSLLLRASRSRWLAEHLPRRPFVQRAVRRFMPGEDLESALGASAELGRAGLGTILTNLGERTESREQARAVRDHYHRVVDAIRDRALPTHVSVKLTHLGLDLDPDLCLESVVSLAEAAGRIGSTAWIDMEESGYVDRTIEIFRAARAASPNVGLCLQSYLRRTPADLESLLPLSPAIRLVKGAYREPDEVAYPKKRDTDRAFFELGRRLLDAAADGGAFPVFGTHDLELLARIRNHAESRATDRWEVHMLYGIESAAQRALAAAGAKVRVLISYGEQWFPWYVRRLAERPANVWFVVKNLWVG